MSELCRKETGQFSGWKETCKKIQISNSIGSLANRTALTWTPRIQVFLWPRQAMSKHFWTQTGRDGRSFRTIKFLTVKDSRTSILAGNSFFDFAMKKLLKTSERRILPQKRLSMSHTVTPQTNHPVTTESFNQKNWLRFVSFLSSKWKNFTFLKLFSPPTKIHILTLQFKF